MRESSQATAVANTVVRPRWYSHGLDRLLAYYRLASGCARTLPRAAHLAAARMVGRVLSGWLARARARVRSNLVRVLPELGAAALDTRVTETFTNFAACFADLLTLTRDARYRIVAVPPIWVEPGEEVAAVATMIGALERAVRAQPTQWFNFFDVWSPPVAAA